MGVARTYKTRHRKGSAIAEYGLIVGLFAVIGAAVAAPLVSGLGGLYCRVEGNVSLLAGPCGDREDPGPAATGYVEFGKTTFSQVSATAWTRIDFSQVIPDAVVVAGPTSHDGADPAALRIRNVSETGFEIILDEWDYLDGAHIAETLSWVAGPAGTHLLLDGTAIALGRAEPSSLSGGTVALSGFSSAPRVFAVLEGGDYTRALTHRLQAVGATSFTYRAQPEEAKTVTAILGGEALSWVAIAPGAGGPFASGQVATGEVQASIGRSLAGNEAFLADMQTRGGSDAATVRYAGASPVMVHIDEESSGDYELDHADEVIGWVIAPKGAYEIQ